MIRSDKVWEDLISGVVKCDINFGHGNKLKVANKNLWDLPLNLKLTDWNPKKIKKWKCVPSINGAGFGFFDSLYSLQINACDDPFSDPISLIKRLPAISNKCWSSTSMKL